MFSRFFGVKKWTVARLQYISFIPLRFFIISFCDLKRSLNINIEVVEKITNVFVAVKSFIVCLL